jgi:hypothetical protein
MRQSKAFTKLGAVVQAGIEVPVEFRNFERAKYELEILARRELPFDLQEVEVSFEPGETKEQGKWWITGNFFYIHNSGLRLEKKFGMPFGTEDLKDIPELMRKLKEAFKEQGEEFDKWKRLIGISSGVCPQFDDSKAFKIGDKLTVVPNYCAREGVDNGD